MKRITLLFCLLAASLGYAQTDVIENFDGDAPTIVAESGTCAPGTYTVVDTQSASAPNSLEIITTAAGSPWQGTELVLQGDALDLTTNKTIFVDVFSEGPAGILAKVTAGGPAGTSGANHPGGGWETLTFNLDDQSDGDTSADGIYTNLIFYPLWGTEGGYSGQGTDGCVSANPITIYVDNIIGTAAGEVPETCTDGILNNEEEQIDCGGPNCDDCPEVAEPTTPAPTPPTSNSAGYFSIYSDTYTDQPNVEFGAFGVGAQDISEIEIAPGDNILKVVTTAAPGQNFLFADWATTVDVSNMTNYHIDYWIDTPFITGLIMDHKWSNHAGDDGETSAFSATPGVTTLGQWVSVDIPISAMTNGDANQVRDALRQYVLTVAGAELDTRVVYFDNIYLYNSALSTDEFDLSRVSVAPNPTNSVWNVKINNQNITSINVFDILGKQVITLAPNSSEASIDASALKDGIYLAKITSVNGTRTIKLVKN